MLEGRIGPFPEVDLKTRRRPRHAVWDRAAIFEALARASFTAGDAARGADWRARAAAAAAAIADVDDRRVIEDDLASLPD